MSSLLVTEAFRARGIPAQYIDARDIVVTSDHVNEAEPKPGAISNRARDRVVPLVRAGVIPVLEGYIGATAAGMTTTLGRGGSDYTASLLGAALGAEDIEIGTDVDGMLTARSASRGKRQTHLADPVRRSVGARVIRSQGAASKSHRACRSAWPSGEHLQHAQPAGIRYANYT